MGRSRLLLGLAIAATLGAGAVGVAQAYDEGDPSVQDASTLTDPEIYTGYFGMNDAELAALADDRASYGLTDDECLSIVFIARAAGVEIATAVRDYCGPCHRSLDLLMSRYGVPRESLYVDLPADTYVPPVYQPLYSSYWYGGYAAYPYCNADCSALIDFRVGYGYWHCPYNVFFARVSWTGSPCWALHQCHPWGAHPATWNGNGWGHAHGAWNGDSTWAGAHGSWGHVASAETSAHAPMPAIASERSTATPHAATMAELRRPAPAPASSHTAATQGPRATTAPATRTTSPHAETSSTPHHPIIVPAAGAMTRSAAPGLASPAPMRESSVAAPSGAHASTTTTTTTHEPRIVHAPPIVHAPSGSTVSHVTAPTVASAPHAPNTATRPPSAVSLPHAAGGYATHAPVAHAPSVAGAPRASGGYATSAVASAPHGYSGGGMRASGGAVAMDASLGGFSSMNLV